MTEEHHIRCIVCPLGCMVRVVVDNHGAAESVDGHQCKDGKKYALEEYRNPVRVLTATVLTASGSVPLLPVRSSQPLPKTRLLESMRVLAGVTVRPPVRAGEVIIPRLLGTGADLVATADLKEDDS